MTQLLPHQRVAAEFLAARKTALLADGMRVGKTPSAIGGADLIGARDVLWLTRGAARAEHARAWKRFQTIDRPINVLETGKDRPAPGVTVCSYDLAAGPLCEPLTRPYDLIVLDESHRLKTRDAKRTEAVYGEKCDGSGLIACAGTVWHLSGTPAPNHPAELWPMLYATMPEAIPQKHKPKPMRYWEFVDRFCTTQENYLGRIQITGGKNIERLKALMQPYTLRRRLDEVMSDLPKLMVDTLALGGKLKLPAGSDIDIEAVNKVLDEHGIAGLAKIESRAAVLRRLTGLAKVDAMVAWANERLEDNNDKLVLMAHHVEVVEHLVQGLRAFCPVALYGGTSSAQKREAVPTFTNEPTCRVFVGNITSAGEAIDLSVADELVMVESSWVPGENEQACMRVVNLGKKRPTLARFAMLAGSYDERVAEACAAKAQTVAELFS